MPRGIEKPRSSRTVMKLSIVQPSLTRDIRRADTGRDHPPGANRVGKNRFPRTAQRGKVQPPR
eukprot:9091551-Pyramimonas_sp.AAC.1